MRAVPRGVAAKLFRSVAGAQASIAANNDAPIARVVINACAGYSPDTGVIAPCTAQHTVSLTDPASAIFSNRNNLEFFCRTN